MTEGPSIGMLTWTSPVPTGGNVYDDRLADELVAAGVDFRRHRVRGTWPSDSERHRGEVARALRSQPVWLIDSIVACAVPDLVVEAAHRGHPPAILLHSLLSAEVGLSDADRLQYQQLEAAALRAARLVITTSQWTADDLRRRYGVTETVVAPPGVDRAALVTGTPEGSRLLCLASLTPTKDQLGLVVALSRISDLPWSAQLVGGDLVRPDYTAAVRDAIRQRRLSNRVTITGPRTGSELEQIWAQTDLLVLTSRSETYGMVVAEALSRGIPAIVSSGTGAAEALGHVDGKAPGIAVPPGDPEATAAAVLGWLTDPRLRERWRITARARRDTLTPWARCASLIVTAMIGRT